MFTDTFLFGFLECVLGVHALMTMSIVQKVDRVYLILIKERNPIFLESNLALSTAHMALDLPLDAL